MSGYKIENRSKGEQRISAILDSAGIPYEIEYSFKDLVSGEKQRPLRFDFAVFDDNGDIDFLIEYQGEQHYKPVSKYRGSEGLRRQKYNDNLKRRYCADHNIKLIEVPYSDFYKLDYDYLMTKIL